MTVFPGDPLRILLAERERPPSRLVCFIRYPLLSLGIGGACCGYHFPPPENRMTFKDMGEFRSFTLEREAAEPAPAPIERQREVHFLNEYQRRIAEFDQRTINPGTDWYYALKMNGEAGEVAEMIGKANRCGKWAKPIEGERLEALKLELGDVLWYVARLAAHYGMTLSDVATANVEKLAARHSVQA